MNPHAHQFGQHAIEICQDLHLAYSIRNEEYEYFQVHGLAPEAIGVFISSLYEKAMMEGLLYDEAVAAYGHIILHSVYDPSSMEYTFQLTDY